jgi:hypothetical protein
MSNLSGALYRRIRGSFWPYLPRLAQIIYLGGSAACFGFDFLGFRLVEEMPEDDDADPEPLTDEDRVYRGTSWDLSRTDRKATDVRKALYGYGGPNDRLHVIGFRLVEEV